MHVCELCKLNFSSQQELNEHDWSLLHHRQLDKEKGRDMVHTCTLCKEDMFGLLAFTKHIHSEKHTHEATKLKYSESKETSHLSTPIQPSSSDATSMPRQPTTTTTESVALPAAHFLPRARYFQSLENPLACAPIDPLMRNIIRRPPPNPRMHHRFTPQHRPFLPTPRTNFRPRLQSNSSSHQSKYSRSANTSSSSISIMADSSISSINSDRSNITSYPRATVQAQNKANLVSCKQVSQSSDRLHDNIHTPTSNNSDVHNMINNVMDTAPIIPLTDESGLLNSEPIKDKLSSLNHLHKKPKFDCSRKNELVQKPKKKVEFLRRADKRGNESDSSLNSTGDEMIVPQNSVKGLNRNGKRIPSKHKEHTYQQRTKRNKNIGSNDNLNLNVQFVLKKGREIVKKYNKSTVSKLSSGLEKSSKTGEILSAYEESNEEQDMELIVPCISNVHSIAPLKDFDVSTKENYTSVIGEQEALHDALLQQMKPVRVELSSLSPASLSSKLPKKVDFVQGKSLDPALLLHLAQNANKDSNSLDADNVTIEDTALSFSLGSLNSLPSPRASTPSLPEEVEQSSTKLSKKKKKRKHKSTSSTTSTGEESGNRQREEITPDEPQESSNNAEPTHLQPTGSSTGGSGGTNDAVSTTLGDVEDIEKDVENNNELDNTSPPVQETSVLETEPEPVPSQSTQGKRIESGSKVKQRFRRISTNCNFSALTDPYNLTNSSAVTNEAGTNLGNNNSPEVSKSLNNKQPSPCDEAVEDVESLRDVIIIDYDSEDEADEVTDSDVFTSIECKIERCNMEDEKPMAEHHCEFRKKDGTYCHNIAENRFCDYHRRVVKAVELFVADKMAAGSSKADAVSLIDVDESEFEAVSSRRKSDCSHEKSPSNNELEKSSTTKKTTSEAKGSSTPETATAAPKISKARKQARFKYLRSLTTTLNNEVLKSNLPPTVRKLLDKKNSNPIGPNVPLLTANASESDNDPVENIPKSMDRFGKMKGSKSKKSKAKDGTSERSPDGTGDDESLNHIVNDQENHEISSAATAPEVSLCVPTSVIMSPFLSSEGTTVATNSTVTTTTAASVVMSTPLAESVPETVVQDTTSTECIEAAIQDSLDAVSRPCSPPVLNGCNISSIPSELLEMHDPASRSSVPDIVKNAAIAFSTPKPAQVALVEKSDDAVSFNIEPLCEVDARNDEAFVTCEDVHFQSVSESGSPTHFDTNNGDTTVETFKSFDSDEPRTKSITLPVVGVEAACSVVTSCSMVSSAALLSADETTIEDLEDSMDRLITEEEESLDKLLRANNALEQMKIEMARLQDEISLHSNHIQTISVEKKKLWQKLRDRRSRNRSNKYNLDETSIPPVNSFGVTENNSVMYSSEDNLPLSVLRTRTLSNGGGTSHSAEEVAHDVSVLENSELDEDFSCGDHVSVYDTPPDSLKSEKCGTKRPSSECDEPEEAATDVKNLRTLRSRPKRNKNVK